MSFSRIKFGRLDSICSCRKFRHLIRSPTPLNMTWLHVEHLDWENKDENGIVANPTGHEGTKREILNYLSSTGLYLKEEKNKIKIVVASPRFPSALRKEFSALHQEHLASKLCGQCK